MRIFCLHILIVIVFIQSCQKTPTEETTPSSRIDGVIINDDSDPVYGAVISINNKTTETNEQGFFTHDLENGSYELLISAYGYTKKCMTVNIKTGVNDIELVNIKSLNESILLNFKGINTTNEILNAFSSIGLKYTNVADVDGIADAHLHLLKQVIDHQQKYKLAYIVKEIEYAGIRDKNGQIITVVSFMTTLNALFRAALDKSHNPYALIPLCILLDDSGNLLSQAPSLTSATEFDALDTFLLLSSFYTAARISSHLPKSVNQSLQKTNSPSNLSDEIGSAWLEVPVSSGNLGEDIVGFVGGTAGGFVGLAVGLKASFGLGVATAGAATPAMPYIVSGSTAVGAGFGSWAATSLYKMATNQVGQPLSSHDVEGIVITEDGQYTATNSTITVTEPNSSTVWTGGQTNVTITWTSENVAGDVYIELLKGGIVVTTVSSSTQNDGRYIYNVVPLDISAGIDYQIRITSASNNDISAKSNYFEIKSQESVTITVTLPNRSTVWTKGKASGAIQWTATGSMSSQVRINLFKGTAFAVEIANSTSNDGNYSGFVVPSNIPAANDYIVQIHTLDLHVIGYSDPFTIQDAVTGNIEVLSPNTSTVWQQGQRNVPIYWETGDLGGYVKIDLYQGSTYILTINHGTDNDGTYFIPWLNSRHSPRSDYKIKITSTSDQSRYDYSASFSIETATVNAELTEPTVSTKWRQGQENVAIRWIDGNVDYRLKIDIYKGGSFLKEIYNSYSVMTRYWHSWDVPSNFTPGSDYQIKIAFTTDVSMYDFSQYFSIMSISTKNLRVVEPNASTVAVRGTESLPISWDHGDLGGSVSIELYKGGSMVWDISGATSNDGVYVTDTLKRVPSDLIPGNDYRIKLSHTTQTGKNAYSDYFTIQ